MREPEDEGFAGELRSIAPVRRASDLAPRLRAAFVTGIKAGIVPSVIVFVAYFLLNRDAGLPWVRLGSILAIYGPAIGVLLATFVELFVFVTDRIAKLGFGLWLVANPVTAGGFAGALAGIAPGAVGVVVFGAYKGPFVGTGLIAFGLIAGSVMVAVPLAIRARRARGIPDDRAMIGVATVSATLILCAAAAVIAPIIVGSAFHEVRGAVDEFGGIVGAVAGAAGGMIVGVFIGLVIALGRSLGVRAWAAPPARTVSSPSSE
ncbi:MAG: hypothetical protein ABI867_22770 [Kofleriaceae bacterium]